MDFSKVLRLIEVPMLILVPVTLIACTVMQVQATGLFTMVVALMGVLVFFASFEASKPQLSQIMPAVVLSAISAAGRVLFAAVPNVQPVTAIAIIAGAAFGKRCGFMVGALSALVSSIFLGMGPWSAWQMYSWGLVGYLAGVLADVRLFGDGSPSDPKPKRVALYVFGALASFLFGFIMNTWMIVAFVQPFSWAAAFATYLTGVAADTAHAVGTVVFLLVLYAPWRRKLERIKRKYALL